MTLVVLPDIITVRQGGGVIIYAIVETGGKQFRVSQGTTIKVESLDAADGATVELDRVMAVSDNGKLSVGNPTIEGASVLATVKKSGLGKKVIIFKYKSKTRYSRKLGHRQPYTEITVDSIKLTGEQESKDSD